jgi:ABC-type nitrate/sulfonate/bicarbonate transport system substrate-binding protein
MIRPYIFKSCFQRVFPLPSWERVRVRGYTKYFSPSPQSSPVKGEDVRLAPAFPKVLCLIILLGLGPLGHAGAENIKIGVPSITITTMPLLVARDAGFFQQEGFQTELVVMAAAMNIKVLLSGDIQYATTVGSAVVAAVRGINVRTAMVFVDKPLLDLVGAPGVSSIQELKGKPVGISSRGGLHDVSLRRILSQSGLDPAQVTVLTVGGQGAMFAAIKTGRIAAGLLNPPYNFVANREGMKSLAFAGNFVRLPSTGLVTLGETLEKSPEQVRRMTRALARARTFAKDHKTKVIPILKKGLRIDEEDLISRIYDYHKQAETADGRIEANLVSEVIRDTRQSEGITKEIPANQVFDFSYLPQR